MKRKIVKIEEAPKEKEGLVEKAKSVGKTVLKVAGGILLSILTFYGILAINPDLGRVVRFR